MGIEHSALFFFYCGAFFNCCNLKIFTAAPSSPHLFLLVFHSNYIITICVTIFLHSFIFFLDQQFVCKPICIRISEKCIKCFVCDIVKEILLLLCIFFFLFFLLSVRRVSRPLDVFISSFKYIEKKPMKYFYITKKR